MKRFLFCLLGIATCLVISAADKPTIKRVQQLNRQAVEVIDNEGHVTLLDFYGPKIFRMFRDDQGGILRNPEATPPAEILVRDARQDVKVSVEEADGRYVVNSQYEDDNQEGILVAIDKTTGCISIENGQTIVTQTAPIEFRQGGYELRLSLAPEEYYFGGGVQNGRFSHRGKRIDIVNTNSWTDGGVCSPAPFYWSTEGYGVLCHTFKPGYYDFSGKEVLIHHDADYLDVFFMVGENAVDLLNGYYQLTGHPVLLPKFAFYEGHLNAYNRDYWKETDDPQRGVPFEDGRRYVESQTDNGGVRESLNGDVGDYQFSGRAVIDRYEAHDMPLGWVLPNDGYGAGYGQTETLDGNIQNLKSFGDYARSKGVEIGLWTQSNLHPIDSIPALLQRDIVKEVRDAGVRVLKTDVAWVGAGYSFGLNGIADVAEIMPYYGNQARPFIISLDGWAGTQRYAGIWTGDQTGGEWEYIRFHIPTYIGAGLAGMPNVTSDMDGIFGGRNMDVNVRDFQWKTFTPMQLNMDGWGSNEKYPQALGEPATSINRSYLKWKSALLPYTYTYAHEAIDGKPLIRAMFLEECDGEKAGPELRKFLLGTRTQYQYMYGPSFLIAPIYEEGAKRDNIYLPSGIWYDYFTGDAYEGGCILNSFDTPLWKLPVFVKEGAIIPMNNPNNNPSEIDETSRTFEIYPSEELTSIDVYDDDGVTDAYRKGESSTTRVTQQLQKGREVVTVYPMENANALLMEARKKTRFIVNLASEPKKVVVKADGKRIQATTKYEAAPELNQFATPGSEMEKLSVKKNPQLVVDVPAVSLYNKVELIVEGVESLSSRTNGAANEHVILQTPSVNTETSEATAYTLTPIWLQVDGAEFYELMFEGMRYTNIRNTKFKIDQLQPETDYEFMLRAVGKQGVSDWKYFSLRTAANPLEFAMRGITAICSVEEQPGSGIEHLFDFDDKGDLWHTNWQNSNAVPFTIDIDLHATTEIDHISYVPRDNAGNGNILAGTIETSVDGKNWNEAKPFKWNRNNLVKEVDLQGETARYMRLVVTEAVGGFGSGTELFVFRKPDAKVLIPGDINQDGRIDDNDLTSYLNYTGLRQGDSDFDGYVSVGDVNRNGLIDAQDISNVATLLGDGAGRSSEPLAGKISVKADRTQYNAGNEIVITVTGQDLQSVNAMSFVLPYNQQQMQFVGIEPVAVSTMQNMTNDRLHTNGDRVLYPTFVNVGRQPLINGSQTLFRLRFKALSRVVLKQMKCSGMLVDRQLNVVEF
ncbi:MAG: discoidin domain-containing protein [Prevotella sp.]|nr:discoidin domain-containing protein [Prevotella sp.]